MRFNHVCIEGLGYELPNKSVTSEEIERKLSPVYDRLRLPYGRLELMSGIRERRFWDDGVRPSEVGILAANKAISNSGISRDDIGCLIYGAVCRDFLEPATASIVHGGLNLSKNSSVFDVSNACLGFMNGMVLLSNMIELGQVKAGMVVSGENGKQLVDTTIKNILDDSEITRKSFKSYFASLTIGAGAAAAVLTHSSISKTGNKLLGGIIQSDTRHSGLCVGGAETEVAHIGHVNMQTDSEALLVKGIKLAKDTWEETKKELGWENDSPTKIFCHQVGSAHRNLLYKELNLNLQNDFSTFETLGNVGSASLPITMAMGIEKGFVKKGDFVAMMGIGSGINCLMLGAEW